MSDERKVFTYVVYRPFYMEGNVIAKPKAVVQCAEIEAMCINTMQPMTLRKIDDNRQSETSNRNENV